MVAMVAVTGGLTSINLSENLLGEEGTKVICEALEQNMTLKELDISGREPWSNIVGQQESSTWPRCLASTAG